MTEMTPEREQEIRNRRLDEVTAGPWLVANGVEGRPVVYIEKTGGGFPGRVLFTAVTASEADVQFVASARRSVPELLAELERLRNLADAYQRNQERRAAESEALEARARALQEENAELAAHVEFRMEDIERLRTRVEELETFAQGCDGEGCVLPHSSWCQRAIVFAESHNGCTCGRPWEESPQPHAGHCWLLSPPQSEVEQLRARVAELEALKPAAIQTCRVCGAGYDYGQPCSTCAFNAQMAAAATDLPEAPRA